MSSGSSAAKPQTATTTIAQSSAHAIGQSKRPAEPKSSAAWASHITTDSAIARGTMRWILEPRRRTRRGGRPPMLASVVRLGFSFRKGAGG